MDDKLRIKLTNRYKKGGGSQNAPRHPEAKAQGPFMSHRREANILRGIPMRKPYAPTTPAEVRMAYRGLVNFMEFFGGDRKLAARSCGVSLNTINSSIKRGYLTPYLALAAQKIPEMPWLPGGLCPHIRYEEDWDVLRGKFDGWIENSKRMVEHTRIHGVRGHSTGRPTTIDSDPPPAWARKRDVR